MAFVFDVRSGGPAPIVALQHLRNVRAKARSPLRLHWVLHRAPKPPIFHNVCSASFCSDTVRECPEQLLHLVRARRRVSQLDVAGEDRVSAGDASDRYLNQTILSSHLSYQYGGDDVHRGAAYLPRPIDFEWESGTREEFAGV